MVFEITFELLPFSHVSCNSSSSQDLRRSAECHEGCAIASDMHTSLHGRLPRGSDVVTPVQAWYMETLKRWSYLCGPGSAITARTRLSVFISKSGTV